MATIGYFEGTDPLVLTKLVLNGIETTPVSNGYDNHGRYVMHMTRQDTIAAVVGYLHKVMASLGVPLGPHDFVTACHTQGIPLILIVPRRDQENARRLLGEAAEWAALVDPEEVFDQLLALAR
jgi:hypothetical protein